MSCLGKYLEISGVDKAMIESGVFGKGVVEGKVLNGGHHIKGKDGMSLVAECFNALLLQQFLVEESENVYEPCLESVKEELE